MSEFSQSAPCSISSKQKCPVLNPALNPAERDNLLNLLNQAYDELATLIMLM